MTLLEMKRRYAYLLAKVGVNVQKGQKIFVDADIDGYEFTPLFAEECYKLGASEVAIRYTDIHNLKVRTAFLSAEEAAKASQADLDYYQYHLDNKFCSVRLECVNIKDMEGFSEERTSAAFRNMDSLRNIMRRAGRVNGTQWLVAMIPNQEWADLLFPGEPDNLTKLWYTLFDLCYVGENNDIEKTWADNDRIKDERGIKIDSLNLKELHYTASNGTDLTVTLTPYSHFNSTGGPKPSDHISFMPNIPTEEICLTPEKYGTNGVVYSSRPLVLGGKCVENFGFRFKDGKVIEVIAEEGRKILEDLIATDENAGYLGEVALIAYHSPISLSGLVYYTTLIDENASCHLALGRGLNNQLSEDCKYTFNNSSIHVDFMIGTPDMSIIGTDHDGKTHIIFKDGDFAL